MILYPNQGAGLCNRLLAAAHLIAHAEASGNVLVHGALRRYARYFEGLPRHGVLVHRPARLRRRTMLRAPFAVLRSGLFPPGEIPFADPVVSRAEQAAVLLLIGWRFRDQEALHAHGALVRALFRPKARHQEVVTRCLAALRSTCDHVVGVHIRRTDYADFREGCYYYPDAVYRRVMAELSKQLTGRVGFLMSSDSPIDDRAFPGMAIQHAPGHELEDLYALAGCDLIIGPPSTYSMWAAFYGKVPLHHIATAEAGVTLDAFQPVQGA